MSRAVPALGLILLALTGCGNPLTGPSGQTHVIKYEVSLGYSYYLNPRVDVSWIGADGSLHLVEQATLPWRQTVRVPSGTFLLVSARRNPPFSGQITVAIYEGTRRLRRVTNIDGYTSATAWVEVP